MEVNPLTSLNSLISWSGPGTLENFLESVPLLTKRSSPMPYESTENSQSYAGNFNNKKVFEKSVKKSQRALNMSIKTLVCHDFKGGYLDDRFCYGTSASDSYRFYHWNSIDIFVYFSHSFVTIPPCGWVSAAHINGVKVLGTIITEGEHGESIWDTLLDDENVVEICINNLVDIAQTYHFDGWLLNVENRIKPEKIEELIYFVTELTRRMKQRMDNSLVIWYDSVTCNGDLKWQNKLNDKNKCFFDSCDGIFLNYAWDDDCLRESVTAASDRVQDVYVGIDVFGRNFYEGGGFNTSKAFDVIRKYDLSAAVFAPGWVYQVLGRENFFTNQNEFWNSFAKHLLYYGPVQLPLKTAFCQGFGQNLFKNGEIIEAGPWYNLSKLQVQPSWERISEICSINTDTAFNGGSCFTFWIDGELSINLLRCQIEFPPLLEFEFSYRLSGYIEWLYFFISIATENEEGNLERRSEIRFMAESDSKRIEASDSSLIIADSEEGKESNGWTTKKFLMERSCYGNITTIGLTAKGPGVIYFGEMGVKEGLIKEKKSEEVIGEQKDRVDKVHLRTKNGHE